MIVRGACAALVFLYAMMVPVAAASTPGVLRYSDNQDIVSLNPFLVSSGNIAALSELTMAHFTRMDAHGAFIPELVTEIPTMANHGVSSDGKTITWHVRRNVRWSDGVPFDADDVVYSVGVARDPANNLVDRSGWDQLVAVDEPNRYTVVFHLKATYAVFLASYFSTVSNSCILPKHILGPSTAIDAASAGVDIGNGSARSALSPAASAYNGLPVGIGPFRYAAFHRGDDVEMEANPFYWRGRPKLDRIVYKIVPDANTLFAQMAAGEVDLWDEVTAAVVDRVRALPGRASSVRPSDAISGLFFNVERVPDAAVRAALRLATDRGTIFNKVAHRNGVFTQSLIPETVPDAQPLPVGAYDPIRAAAQLDAAGWRRGPDGVRAKAGRRLSLEIAIPAGSASAATLADVVRDGWARIGVDVRVRSWAPAEFFGPYSAGGTLATGKFDVALLAAGLGPVYADLGGLYDCASVPPGGSNYSRYCHPALDVLIHRYDATYDAAARRRETRAMERILDTDVPAIVLFERTFTSVYDARLRGYAPSAYSAWGDPLDLEFLAAP